jgi:hypothetical protein
VRREVLLINDSDKGEKIRSGFEVSDLSLITDESQKM